MLVWKLYVKVMGFDAELAKREDADEATDKEFSDVTPDSVFNKKVQEPEKPQLQQPKQNMFTEDDSDNPSEVGASDDDFKQIYK